MEERCPKDDLRYILGMVNHAEFFEDEKFRGIYEGSRTLYSLVEPFGKNPGEAKKNLRMHVGACEGCQPVYWRYVRDLVIMSDKVRRIPYIESGITDETKMKLPGLSEIKRDINERLLNL